MTPDRTTFEQLLRKYGAMSVAAAAAITLTPKAQAGVIYHNAGDVTTDPSYEHSSVFFSMTNAFAPTNSPAYTSSGPSNADFWLHHHWSSAALRIGNQCCGVGSNRVLQPYSSSGPARLAANALIGSGGPWGAASYFGAGWTSDFGRGYVGLLFYIGGQPRYGWADITLHSDFTSTLHGWAYEDSGAPIRAGQGAGAVPEPASIALMALGAAGLALYRKRSKAA